jgi:hypothetical protein
VTAAVGVALVVVDVGVAFAPPLSVAVAVDVLVALLDGLVAAAVGVGVGALLPACGLDRGRAWPGRYPWLPPPIELLS